MAESGENLVSFCCESNLNYRSGSGKDRRQPVHFIQACRPLVKVSQAKVAPISAESSAQQHEPREGSRRHFPRMAQVNHDRRVIGIFLERIAANAAGVVVRETFGARNNGKVMLGVCGHGMPHQHKAPGPTPAPIRGPQAVIRLAPPAGMRTCLKCIASYRCT